MEVKYTNGAESGDVLLKRARAGDENAFITLFRRHHTPVFRFLLYMCGSRDTAEEVIQDVFLALLQPGSKYSEAAGDLEAYLIGMARNLLRKHLRQARRSSNWERAPELATAPELLETMSREQQLAALNLAILRLPPRYREVIVLCELEGMALARAAGQLGIALGTVKSRLNRARTILRAKLRDREECTA